MGLLGTDKERPVLNEEVRNSVIKRRIDFIKTHPVWRSQYSAFVKAVAQLRIPPGATALSVSCGDGTWDFLAVSANPNLRRIIATDVVDCPVSAEDVRLLQTKTAWSFQKVPPDMVLPLDDDCCRLVLHQDVLEHTKKPFLLLKENHRVLERGGYLLCGTPNIFRPANIAKLLIGKLTFPCGLYRVAPGAGALLPSEMIHVQEFNQYQLRTMLEESGFNLLSMIHCFFGISFLKIKFCDFPNGNSGRNLCQYIFCVAQKC